MRYIRPLSERKSHEIKVDMPVVSTICSCFPIGFRRIKKLLKSSYGFKSSTTLTSIVRLCESGAIGMCDCKNECHMINREDREEVFIICALDKCPGWIGRRKTVKA